jgi:cell wall-associated NlpC family hydrolase
MASMRSAAAFLFSASALVSIACTCEPARSSPLLPASTHTFDSSDSMPASAVATSRVDVSTHAVASIDAPVKTQASPRRVLADFAMKLRNIAYVRGGRELSTGFDCSGFVRYVYQQSLGLVLPSNSSSQFEAGNHVARDELKMGDLVFFRTEGRRVSHVGIYLDNGLFIHSPSRGKRVRIDHLAETYWAKRFAGAKRPDVLT